MNVKSEELAKYYKQKYPLTFTKGTFKKEPFLAERYEAAWKIAKKAATVLKNNYGARRVSYSRLSPPVSFEPEDFSSFMVKSCSFKSGKS
jgi:hypothetical protein